MVVGFFVHIPLAGQVSQLPFTTLHSSSPEHCLSSHGFGKHSHILQPFLSTTLPYSQLILQSGGQLFGVVDEVDELVSDEVGVGVETVEVDSDAVLEVLLVCV